MDSVDREDALTLDEAALRDLYGTTSGKDNSSEEKDGGLPPRSLEGEMAILGGIFLDPAAAEKAFLHIRTDDFYSSHHGVVFKAQQFVFQRDGKCDLVSVSAALGPDVMKSLGGLEYLESLIESVPTTGNINYHVGIVKEKSHLRRLMRLGSDLIERANDEDGTSAEIAADTAVLLDKAASTLDLESQLWSGARLVDAYMDDLPERLWRVKRGTGFPDIDVRLTEGYAPGRLSVIGGRPGMGKSAFATSVIVSLCRRPHSVFFASLEMDAISQVDRIVSMLTGIPLKRLLSQSEKPLVSDQITRIQKVMAKIERWNLQIYDGEAPSVSWLIRMARARHIRNPIDVVVIDLFDYIDELQQYKGQPQLIERWIKRLRRIGKTMGWHICLVVQMSRATEKESKDYVPRLHQLKGSGGWEQTADLAFLLHRPNYYKPGSGSEDICYVHCAKQRQGDQFIAKLIYDGPCTRFFPWTPLKGR